MKEIEMSVNNGLLIAFFLTSLYLSWFESDFYVISSKEKTLKLLKKFKKKISPFPYFRFKNILLITQKNF